MIQATKAVKMFQDLASKKGAVVKDRTEVVDVIKRGERGRRSSSSCPEVISNLTFLFLPRKSRFQFLASLKTKIRTKSKEHLINPIE